MNSSEGLVIPEGRNDVTTNCCEQIVDGTCTGGVDRDAISVDVSTWSCSDGYADKDFAKTMCPQKQAKCGTVQEVDFQMEGEEDLISVRALANGESCTYRIKAQCGAPGLSQNDELTTADHTKYEITTMEFNEEVVVVEEGRDKPDKTVQFNDYGDGAKDGQRKPPFRDEEGAAQNSDGLAPPPKKRFKEERER